MPARGVGRNRWARLIAMDRAELFDRIRQESAKRVDAMLYRAGHDFTVAELTASPAPQPHFFFRPEQVPGLISLLRERLPQEAEHIVRQAEKICRHHLDLLGYEDLEYGEQIDWHGDRVHGKRAPRKPFYKVRYLDFDEVGDTKVTWEINRHQHLVTLAKAYRLTGEERFANEIFRQWQHWHAENPYPIGVNWASSLEVGFRSLSWLWTYFLLRDSPVMPSSFRSEWLRALGINGRYIERYLSTYFSPNTHLLGEAVALFFIGVLCPGLRPADRWKQRGWDIVLHEAQRQVQADGLHFEQSTYYHVYALDFFLHSAVLASINEISIPKEFEETLEKMLDALYLLSRAGAPPRLGDDDGGRVFDPRRNRGEHMLDPLSTGAVLFSRGDLKLTSGGVREETLWLLGADGVSEFDSLLEKNPDPRSVPLRAGGLYLTTSAGAEQQLVIDAGPQGAMRGGHGHADALSICLISKGRPLLIDPGTLEYVGDDSGRDRFRGTAAHNTLQVDGESQAETKGPFAWVRLPIATAERWIGGEGFDLFTGSHDGYMRLVSPVVHRRWLFSLKSRFWIVRDVVLGEGQHRLDLFWHLSSGLKQRQGDDELFLEKDGKHGLAVLTAEGHGWERGILEGWWSPVYGRKEPAPVAHFGIVAELPAEFVSLLIPIDGAAGEIGKIVRMGESATSKLSGYQYRTSKEEHCTVFAQAGEKWSLGPWSSDAEFLYWGVEHGGGVRTLIFCQGSYVEIGGRRVVSSKQRVARCELVSTDQEKPLSSPQRESIVVHEPLDRISLELEPVLLVNSLPDSKGTLSNNPSSGRTGV